jgi:hypothetical protein
VRSGQRWSGKPAVAAADLAPVRAHNRFKPARTLQSSFGGSDSPMSVRDLFLGCIKAYNAKDVCAMLTFFDEACMFESISDGKVTLRTEGGTCELWASTGLVLPDSFERP